jgi:hypothetical protein
LITVLEEKLKPYIFHFHDSVCFQNKVSYWISIYYYLDCYY